MNLERLYFLREEKDLTQDDIGAILGVSKSAISKWENGKEIIPLNKLNELANYFNTSLDYLVGLSNEKTYPNIKKDIDRDLISIRLKEFRKEKGLSQRDLAQIFHTGASTFAHYETKRYLILTSLAYSLCKKYNLSLDYLCGKK